MNIPVTLFISTILYLSILRPVGAASFDFDQVVDKAAALAAKPYEAPEPIPEFLRDLSFDAYRGIRFRPAKNLWRNKSRFQVMLVSPGLYYTHAVKINVVDGKGVHTVPYRKEDFTFPPGEIESRIPSDLGFAGFKLTYPFRQGTAGNQFLVFAGSSYFRGVGKNNVFGISARGIAVDTGLPSGEQFPSFTEYWLVRPLSEADRVTFYALLNGESLTGAYRFLVTPGNETTLDIKAVLFPRKDIQLTGIAPLTSMFFYGKNTPRPTGEWRPEVHDSDGLLIQNGGSGERLWRPLINPEQLIEEYFETENVRGFGLLQRGTRFCEYQDPEARYDKRPSTWVSPRGDWGRGHIVLVEIPATREIEDNIVVFWSPGDRVTAGKKLTYDYTLSFGDSGVAREETGYAAGTFVGDGNLVGGGRVQGSYRVIVDFEGGGLSNLPADTPVTGIVTPLEGTELIESFVEYVAPSRRWRLSILARPSTGKPLSLRAFLKTGDRTLTETWTYRLPWANKIRTGKEPTAGDSRSSQHPNYQRGHN